MRKYYLALFTLLSIFATASQAAIPTAVTDALTAATTDTSTMGGLILVVIIAAATFKYMRRAL